jgi:Uma2 family endonuclease
MQRITVEAYHQMISLGILTENDPVELIRGFLVQRLPTTVLEAASILRLNHWLSPRVDENAIVSVHNPIHLNDSEPEPDLTLLRWQADFYSSGKPRAADVLLVIEVADSTLDFDREVKRELYAEAGIPEYWIVNLVEGCVEIHRQPTPEGVYRAHQTARKGDQLEITSIAGCSVPVDQIL